jgi:hypothetical protein
MKKNEKTCMRTAKGCRTANAPLPWLCSLPCAGFGLCHAAFLCRALASLFTVRPFFAVRSAASLSCVARCRAFYGAFAVGRFVAVHYTSVAWQINLCRVTTHNRV